MRPLTQEQNIEILRQYAILVTETAEQQAREIARLKDERNDGTSAQEFLSRELQDRLTRLQKKFFGFGRESLLTENAAAARPVGHINQQVLGLTERPQDAKSQDQEPA